VRSAGLAQCSLLLCAALITSAGCSNRTKATNPSNPNNPGSPTAPSSASSAVGYVYVNSKTTTSTPDIQTFAYAADATGQLTPLPGSPFTLGISTSAIGTAANKAYVVANSSTETKINTYTIGSNGALTLGPQFDAGPIDTQFASDVASQEHIPSQLAVNCSMRVGGFDRNGQTLYGAVTCSAGSNYYARIASFAVDSSKGSLTYLGNTYTGAKTASFPFLSLLDNDAYAYQVYATGCGTILGGGVFSFARNSDGLLISIHTVISPPAQPPEATSGAGSSGYVFGPAATDATNHVAFIEAPCFFLGGASPPIQLSTYTVNPD
jgi:hypothetical protein